MTQLPTFDYAFLEHAVAQGRVQHASDVAAEKRARDAKRTASAKLLEDVARKHLEVIIGPLRWFLDGEDEAYVPFDYGERSFELRAHEGGWPDDGGHVPERLELRVLCVEDGCLTAAGAYPNVAAAHKLGAALETPVPSRCYQHDPNAQPPEPEQLEAPDPPAAARLVQAFLELVAEHGGNAAAW